MKQLARVLDKESYEWLTANHPELVEAIESEVASGSTLDKVKLFVLRHTPRMSK